MESKQTTLPKCVNGESLGDLVTRISVISNLLRRNYKLQIFEDYGKPGYPEELSKCMDILNECNESLCEIIDLTIDCYTKRIENRKDKDVDLKKPVEGET